MADDMTMPAPKLDTVSFATDTVEPIHRLDAWREFYRGFYDVRPLDLGKGVLTAEARSWRLGALVAGRYNYEAAITTSPESGNIEDRVVLRIYVNGSAHGVIGDRPVQFGPNAVHLLDRSRPYRAISSDVETLIVSVPYETIAYDPSQHNGHHAFAFDTPLGRMLRANLEAIFEAAPAATIEDGHAISSAFLGMLQVILTSNHKDDGLREKFEESREIGLKRYITDNLCDPALSVEVICAAMGVSRTTLYRIFEPEGGLFQFVRTRRLEGALKELAGNAPRRGLIGAAAARWGYPDQSQFNRLFRAHFGFRPGDVIRQDSRLSQDTAGCPDQEIPAFSVQPLASLIG